MFPRTSPHPASTRVAAAILRPPALFTVLLLVAYMLPLREVVDHLRGQPSSDQSVGDLVRQVADLALAVAVIAATGWWRAVGFTWPRAWQSRTLLIGPGIFFGVWRHRHRYPHGPVGAVGALAAPRQRPRGRCG